MAQAYVLQPLMPDKPVEERLRVLVTGAAGRIGSTFARQSSDRYELTLMTAPGEGPDEDLSALGRRVEGDLRDVECMKRLCEGIDTVVHLAACASPTTPWDPVLQNNIIGTYNTFVAAVSAGCRRVVFASSIHAVSGYPVDHQVQMDDPVNPGDLYGVSKCFGEAMARFVSEQKGVSAIVVRIGAFQPISKARDPDSLPLINAFVSQRDLVQLLQRSVDDRRLRFAIVAGLSANPFNRMDIGPARELLGYGPEDDFTQENPQVKSLDLSDTVQPHSERRQDRSGLREQQ